ncbi:hypothetical protein [Mesorhizobium sp. KR1-2]|uniref:hypothetical protein n=1 Tax=Mesorhizobium sp. KR1-2 TaxID=3156609 RepID=UPI0032B5954F
MKILPTGAVLLAASMTPAAAETRYDVKLEQAVMDIVASRMGELRGSFAFRRKPEFVILSDDSASNHTSLETERTELNRRFADGRHPVSERKISRVIIAF